MNPAQTTRPAPRGLSLVELMVGIAVGMFVVAAATMLAATQLGENRRLLLETQVQQDLRATVDLVVREIRRAATYGRQLDAAGLVWSEGSALAANTLQTVSVPVPTQIDFQRARTAESNPGYSSFQLLNGVLWSCAGASVSWPNCLQALTDANALEVTAFTVTENYESPVALPCVRPCPDTSLGPASCRPTSTVRRLTVSLSGRPRAGGAVRTVSSDVRLRNDFLQYGNAPACP
jgi:type IV pilus assembly protein PilW